MYNTMHCKNRLYFLLFMSTALCRGGMEMSMPERPYKAYEPWQKEADQAPCEDKIPSLRALALSTLTRTLADERLYQQARPHANEIAMQDHEEQRVYLSPQMAKKLFKNLFEEVNYRLLVVHHVPDCSSYVCSISDMHSLPDNGIIFSKKIKLHSATYQVNYCEKPLIGLDIMTTKETIPFGTKLMSSLDGRYLYAITSDRAVYKVPLADEPNKLLFKPASTAAAASAAEHETVDCWGAPTINQKEEIFFIGSQNVIKKMVDGKATDFYAYMKQHPTEALNAVSKDIGENYFKVEKTSMIRTIISSRDGKRLVAVLQDHLIVMNEYGEKESEIPVEELGGSYPYMISFSPTGNYLVAVNQGKEKKAHAAHIIALHNDSYELISQFDVPSWHKGGGSFVEGMQEDRYLLIRLPSLSDLYMFDTKKRTGKSVDFFLPELHYVISTSSVSKDEIAYAIIENGNMWMSCKPLSIIGLKSMMLTLLSNNEQQKGIVHNAFDALEHGIMTVKDIYTILESLYRLFPRKQHYEQKAV